MANVKDLSLIVKEPLILKFSDEMEFTIPTEPTLEFRYKLLDFEDKANKAKTNKEMYDLFLEMAALILKQDDSKEGIDKDFLIKNLHESQVQAVIKIYQEQITENNSNPNS